MFQSSDVIFSSDIIFSSERKSPCSKVCCVCRQCRGRGMPQEWHCRCTPSAPVPRHATEKRRRSSPATGREQQGAAPQTNPCTPVPCRARQPVVRIDTIFNVIFSNTNRVFKIQQRNTLTDQSTLK